MSIKQFDEMDAKKYARSKLKRIHVECSCSMGCKCLHDFCVVLCVEEWSGLAMSVDWSVGRTCCFYSESTLVDHSFNKNIHKHFPPALLSSMNE